MWFIGIQCNRRGRYGSGVTVGCAAVGAMDLDYWRAAVHSVRDPPGAAGIEFIARQCDQLYCAELLWTLPGRDLWRGQALRCNVSEVKRRRVLVHDLGCACIWCIAHQGLTGVPV
jgi:hypothetical protein